MPLRAGAPRLRRAGAEKADISHPHQALDLRSQTRRNVPGFLATERASRGIPSGGEGLGKAARCPAGHKLSRSREQRRRDPQLKSPRGVVTGEVVSRLPSGGRKLLEGAKAATAGSLPPTPCGSRNYSLDVFSPPSCETREVLQAGGQRIAASGEDSLRH